MAGSNYQIEPIISSPFDQVAYVVWRTGGTEALVVDPGFDPDAIRATLVRHGLRPSAILNTHGHADHIAGNGALKEAYPDTPLIIGRNEARMLTNSNLNLSAGFGMPLTSPPADRLVEDGDRLDLAGFSLLVREIPGHSPGSVVFIADLEEPPLVLAGDVLFAGSVGRVDFPGGSGRDLVAGIRSKLFPLPDAAIVLPGHGPATTIGHEKAHNPYVGQGADPSALD